MTQPTYATTCPNCGAQLQPVGLSTKTAPWLCPVVHPGLRGFWTAELSTVARQVFRPAHHDFGFGPERLAISAAVILEIEDARVRGSSLRDDQLSIAPLSVLKGIRPLGAFSTLVQAAITSRGL